MSRIKLKSDGAILLGENVSCDGFSCDSSIRVQTHIHTDHMVDFETSKANQDILMSLPTRDLLYALFNADLPYRTNIIALKNGQPHKINGDVVELLPSNHMLGSTQVKVTCADGYRLGYSSDFFWPLEDVIQVDELIVDSTYGDPLRVRRYGQERVEEHLIKRVVANVKARKPTAVIGYNGRLQHAIGLLGHHISCPILCSPKSYPLVDVYCRHGHAMPEVICTDSPEGINTLRSRCPCVAFLTLTEQRHLPWVNRCAKVVLSAFMSKRDDPVVSYDNGDCCISLTDHADFHGTLEYIRATGARIVWTDRRTGNAEALADAVTNQLGVASRVVRELHSLGWG